MRIDVVSIFPEYFAPLSLSLAGKAQDAGVLEVEVHDLRRWTHDRHRTVDDTPYGGGAGMVMKPDPWGEALDELLDDRAVLVVPSPAGAPLTQELAAELAAEPHLVFACGRYEGIDQRVIDHYLTRIPVREVSLGDYVLNGGEVAALAVIEAVARLLPGFMGNPGSLAEESHGTSGLLEYPVYTKPPTWRGLEVPEVLTSGDHGRIAAWRHEQSLRRTVRVRPDLLSPLVLGDGITIRAAHPADFAEILTVQRAAFVDVQRDNPGVEVSELTESVADLREMSKDAVVLVAAAPGRIVGYVRAVVRDGHWRIGRLAVAPDLQGRGIGRQLLERAEALAPDEVRGFEVMTGAGSTATQRFYRRAGYRKGGEVAPGVLRMTKGR